jgi:hypothetical protein
MNAYLTFVTLVEPLYSVYVPRANSSPMAYHQEVDGTVWSEWLNGGRPCNNAFLRHSASALQLAKSEMAARKALEVAA